MFSQLPVKPAKTIDNVYGSAFYHLEAKDRTIDELRKKLVAKTDNQEWIDTVLEDLIGRGYLKSDKNFAINFVEMAFSSEKGSQFILSKLREKGINESIVNEAIAYVSNRDEVCEITLLNNRLANMNLDSLSSDKLYATLTKYGFKSADVREAIKSHPVASTLPSKMQIKADKADLVKEIEKLARKLKGKSVIKRELKQKLIDISTFDEEIEKLEMDGSIDFYENCQLRLDKKRFDLSNSKDKSKAYAYLYSHGFSSDEIKETLS
ncbi:RecX family transcriptional regulator [Aliivibrio sp. S4TY2]|uniref:RecX family transcriptional regulator n=1 Tax=unclassified Aliivibrio TaxID=2645654 RepID=UPI002378C2ED|nr:MULTISPECIES: RecX family transcriptional regulator [unclassified Aliivibrio]MDD9156200.1 RecX family transcriptional regulator [Aliivibrio sp. S4TY2]MDD9160547.1 RecX family transcriptional regulator [Aliivibrio sp. S4TY1]MDD9163908.1 RecX family transcriptional regulator [Aliivibrio sp. S4MY2]MDD9168117.1 RecX family transcriptional regulator [Aliivibrio sp. S4MY4]MDD9185104.1 RecX family transcriptional regulator [Aliivibrio sp. S4MY3]